MSEINPAARWYVAHTYSGYENKVKMDLEKTIENRGLQDLIFEVSVPMQPVIEMKNGVEKKSDKKDSKSDKKSDSKSDTGAASTTTAKKSSSASEQETGTNPLAIVGVAAGVIGLAIVGVFVFTKRR